MNYSRAAGLSRFVVVLIAIVLVCSVTVCGLYISDETQLKGIFEDDAVRLGLDLAGGSVVTFQAQTDDTGDALDTGMESVYKVMRDRLDNQGLTEALCYRVEDDMVTIEIPDVDDPQEAIENFMQTAKLEFRNADDKTVIEGSHIENAYATYFNGDTGITEIGVSLKLTSEGAALFKEATAAAVSAGSSKNYISIVIDGRVISGSTVIKASAGIRTYEDTVALIEAGASRIGTSAGISIVQSAPKN